MILDTTTRAGGPTTKERDMRVIIRPSTAPNLHIDITRPLVAVIAQELARVQEGNDVLNWLEAERILDSLINHAPVQAGPVAPTAEVPEDERPTPRARGSWRRASSSMRDPADTPPRMSATRG
jgi:hypothetical protein